MAGNPKTRSLCLIFLFSMLFVYIVAPNTGTAAVDYSWLQRGVVKIVAVGGNQKEVGAGIVLLSAAPGGTLILTAYHLVEEAEDITVSYFDKPYETFSGKLSQHDEALDIAIIQVSIEDDQSLPTNLPEYVVADFAQIREGDRVSVIGHPLNLDWLASIQTNVIARLNDRGDLHKFRFTNTAIERGSSGGPIFDEGGALIGMVTRFDPIHAIAVKMDVVGKILEERWKVAARAFAPTSWPPNAVPGGSYTVRKTENVLNLPLVRLPADFTLKFANEIRSVTWAVETLEFGPNVTIDLAASREALTPARVNRDGVDGRDGLSLNLNVGRMVPRGSLWIRTDGGPGGNGGVGKPGKPGTPAVCHPTDPHKHRHGEGGGYGWRGRPGGRGGNTSRVRLRILDQSLADRIKGPTCEGTAWPSNRPASAVGNDGRIVIYGAPGVGGQGGRGGPGGAEGADMRCVTPDNPLVGSHTVGGSSGLPGGDGPQGSRGRCVR